MTTIALVATAALILVGCGAAGGGAGTVPVYYNGARERLSGTKDGYMPGETVEWTALPVENGELMILLDGRRLLPEVDDEGTSHFRFVMPERPVQMQGEIAEAGQSLADLQILLVDVFRRGSGDGEGYSEMVLYAVDEASVRLEVYDQGGTAAESMTAYQVPAEAAEAALALIRSSGMPAWNEESGISLDGTLLVAKFPYKEGYLRVSSEQMPEDGEKAFDALWQLIEGYAQPDRIMN